MLFNAHLAALSLCSERHRVSTGRSTVAPRAKMEKQQVEDPSALVHIVGGLRWAGLTSAKSKKDDCGFLVGAGAGGVGLVRFRWANKPLHHPCLPALASRSGVAYRRAFGSHEIVQGSPLGGQHTCSTTVRTASQSRPSVRTQTFPVPIGCSMVLGDPD